MTVARTLAIAVFAAGTNLRMALTRAGLAAGAAILLLGSALSLSAGRGWALDPDLGFFGFLVAALFVLRSGLEEQRETGLADFLRHNLVSPLEHAGGMVLGLLATWIALCTGAFLVVVVASAGAGATAAWFAAAWGLRALLLLGFVPLVESAGRLRLPFILPVLAYFGLLIGAALVLGEAAALRLFAPVERSDPASLRAVAVQASVTFAACTLLFLAATAARARARARSRTVVPPRH